MKNSTVLLQSLGLLTACLLAVPAAALDIRLIAKDGSLDIAGTLLSVQDGQMTVMTAIGEITVDNSQVLCEGAGCPTAPERDYAFNLAAAGDVAEVLVPILFDGFASQHDAEVVLLDETGLPVPEEDFARVLRAGATVPLRMIDFDGQEIANFGLLEAAGAPAFELLAAQDVALVFSQQPLSVQDIQTVASAGGGNLESFEQERVVAVDGLTVISHPDNSVPNISVADVAAIFAGQITNWSQVGGSDAPINVISFAPGSDANRDTEQLLLQPDGLTQSPAATIVNSVRDITAAVTSDPNAIAAVGFHDKRAARAVPLINACGMVIPASAFTIKTEEYPLEKRVVVYSRADPTGLTREFLDHLDSTSLDGLVSKAGFVDLTVVAESTTYADARIAAARAAPGGPAEDTATAAMLADMQATNRLSTTFRFAPRSSDLDNRARRDIARIVAYIRREKPATVYIVGFADSGGSFNTNMRLSEERARQVADQIAASAAADELGSTVIEVRGYSELSPVACNDTFEGRAINRRVEIWTR